jgi:hypothetical protein
MFAMWLHQHHSHRLRNLAQWAPFFEDFAAAAHRKTGGYANCVGFIDGKDWKTCRPVRGQKPMFSGHKNFHGIKSQSLILVNGVIGHFFGPIVCGRHDSHMLTESGLLGVLRHISSVVLQTVVPFAAYGDPAYPLSPVLLRPFKGALTAAKHALNTQMSSGRISVEWGFGRVQANWPYLQHFSRLQILRNGAGVQRHIDNGVLLYNIFTILYGGICPSYFDCRKGLTLEQYLS